MVYVEPNRGIYHGDREWREELDFCWFTKTPFQTNVWRFFSDADQKPCSLRLTDKISERVSHPPDYCSGGVTAVYVADMCSEGSSISTQVIVKIVMRIPYIEIREGNTYVSLKDLLALKPPVEEEYPDEPIRGHTYELEALQYLTKHGCAYTPSLVGACKQNEYNPWVKNGFVGFVIMEKLPGVRLSDIWDYKPTSEKQREEQLRIQESFKAGYVDIRNLGFRFGDEAARNLIWDAEAGKCYFVDFEQAYLDPDPTKPNRTWEELISPGRSLFTEFQSWDIIMEDQYAVFWEAIHRPRKDPY